MTEVPRGRFVGWVVFAIVFAAIAYAGRIAGGEPDRDVLYQYSTAVAGLIEYVIIAGVLLLLLRGLDVRRVLALYRPSSWRRAAGLVAAALVTILIVGAALSPFLNAGKEQGVVPERWEPSHAGAFAANFALVALVAPLVEESLYRGFGVSAVGSFYGRGAAVLATALAFGLAHGLVTGLPVLVAFGAILALLRVKTQSIYPGMVTHALFNAASLTFAVTLGAGK
jgi:membrane protease YdiL (CAAX protease family)